MEKKKLDRENDKNNIALFRFAVISPLINNTNEYKSKEEFYRKASLKKYELPNGFLNNNSFHTHNVTEGKAFEMDCANDCWQGDTSHGPIITIDGKKVQTYLVQLIDDASRLIVGYQFFLNDNALNFQIVLKQAIKTYGVPQKYIRQRILVKYSPEDLSFVYIVDDKTKKLEKAYPVDKISNSKIKRKIISYS